MKMTQNIKNTIALIMAVFMLVACMPIAAFAVDVSSNTEQVEKVLQDIQPRDSYVNFNYPETTRITIDSTMTRMSYTVEPQNANKYILLRLTNVQNSAQYYTYSLVGTTGEYNANVSPGTYTVSVVGGTNTTFSKIIVMFFK